MTAANEEAILTALKIRFEKQIDFWNNQIGDNDSDSSDNDMFQIGYITGKTDTYKDVVKYIDTLLQAAKMSV